MLHVSLTARNADVLSGFYRQVFGFIDRRAPRRLAGPNVWRGNGLPDVDIYSIWLALPGDQGPFLEIIEFDHPEERSKPAVNEPGFSHVAFEVHDLQACIDKVLLLGGTLQGDVTNFGTPEQPCLTVYVRDPEGNILELEQT